MESKKQTAIEWLEEQFFLDDNWKRIFEQAKEMEKEQRAEDWQLGYDSCEFHNDYDELQKEPMKNPYRK
jgi:hypothetical protein